jgi:NADH-quinone oxidoreductase subunit N
LIWLTVIGVITTVVSFYYYLYVIVQMYMRDPHEEFSDVRVATPFSLAMLIAAIGTVGLGVLPARVLEWTSQAAASLQ